MVEFAAVLLRGVIATFAGLLIAGGTLTLAADRATVLRAALVPVAPARPTTLRVPDVSGQAYVFAKGILQDHAFAWQVTGPVQGYAANRVALQRPAAGTVVLDTGAPTITLTLMPNPSYVERGTPDNGAPYAGTAIRLPASPTQHPQTSPRTPAAPNEPIWSRSLSDRVTALAAWLESHRDRSGTTLNHWLYEHNYVITGARLGWWHGAEALQALIKVDKRAEALWGVGSQSRTAAEQALAEVRSRSS